MDLTKLSIDDLKELRTKYRHDLTILKTELQTVQSSIENPQSDVADIIQKILTTRYSESQTDVTTDDDKNNEEENQKAITQIKSLDVSMRSFKRNEDLKLYLYTCKTKFDKLHVEIEYESNLTPDDELRPNEENLTKLNIKIVWPNIQAKLQKGIEFFQQSPNCFSNAFLFIKSINDLIDERANVIQKLYEFEKNLVITISKSSEQHSIIYKCEFDNIEYLHIKWNFKWDLRTGLARDLFTAKIIRADDQLLGDMKPLVEKLCSDKFAFEALTSDKINLFCNILTATKDTDTRNNSPMLS